MKIQSFDRKINIIRIKRLKKRFKAFFDRTTYSVYRYTSINFDINTINTELISINDTFISVADIKKGIDICKLLGHFDYRIIPPKQKKPLIILPNDKNTDWAISIKKSNINFDEKARLDN